MSLFERAGLALLHRLDPEQAHDLSLKALRSGLMLAPRPAPSRRLRTQIAGLELENPLGLAAGYDKNAVALAALGRAGFGFVEVGAATPLPQPGNPKPRLFRLSSDHAVINRFGFNNEGAEAIAPRLAQRPKSGVIGLNLGANKESSDRPGDYARVLEVCGAHIDFATVNVSSPNTAGLRDLQASSELTEVLDRVLTMRDGMDRRVPIFLKIAPDLTDAQIGNVAAVAGPRVDAIIATNTTLSREGLNDAQGREAGGLSGAPLFEMSTRVLAKLSQATESKVPLIGVGGVSTGAQALAKIQAGASAVQLYSALVYDGLSLVGEILEELDKLLAAHGYSNVSEAVGTDRDAWL